MLKSFDCIDFSLAQLYEVEMRVLFKIALQQGSHAFETWYKPTNSVAETPKPLEFSLLVKCCSRHIMSIALVEKTGLSCIII